jgi:hypothetical protein
VAATAGFSEAFAAVAFGAGRSAALRNARQNRRAQQRHADLAQARRFDCGTIRICLPESHIPIHLRHGSSHP